MAAHDGNAEIDYRILWQRDQPRIRKLVAALEQAIVVFSGDRIFCTGCRAEDSGTIDTMKIIHKTLCPLAGVTTRHPSHEGAQCCELDTDHDGDCPVHPAGGKPFVVPQQPGLEFVEINGLSPLHILEQAVKLKSAQRLIEWGQRGWEIAGLLAGQDAREQPRDDHAPTTPRVMGEGQKKAHNSPKTRTPILISAMRLLSWDIQSDDGVANAAIAEAADRLAEYWGWLEHANSVIECLKDGVMPTETANAYLEWRDFFEKQSWSKLGSP